MVTYYFCTKHSAMKQLFSALALAAVASLAFSSCGGGDQGKASAADSVKSEPRKPIAISAFPASPEFPDASLGMAVKSELAGKDSAKVSFTFDVKGYDLKAQTTDNASKPCANSKDGQHIHFIMDNAPYKALYEPRNEVTVAVGSEHYVLCFLSRSYHQSLKNAPAAKLLHFKVDEKGKLVKLDDKAPKLFYSRPKGDYIGKDTANVLLDFYVWNAPLAADGYKVKAEVMNEDLKTDTTFTIATWESNFIQNLGTGKCKVSLTLMDKDGKQVQDAVSREFNLAASEPLKK